MASVGVGWCFVVDVAGLLVATTLFLALRPYPHAGETTPPSLAGIREGIGYAVRRRDLLGTYLVDIAAMLMAMPVVLFPALVEDVFEQPGLLGLLYSAETVGAMVATATSGWVSRVHHHGRAVVVAAACYGAAIALVGLAPSLWVAALLLAVAGAADMVSGIFRSTIWNQTIPDAMRGRLAGVEMLSYSVGPLGGQTRAGLVADAWRSAARSSAAASPAWSRWAAPRRGCAGSGTTTAAPTSTPSPSARPVPRSPATPRPLRCDVGMAGDRQSAGPFHGPGQSRPRRAPQRAGAVVRTGFPPRRHTRSMWNTFSQPCRRRRGVSVTDERLARMRPRDQRGVVGDAALPPGPRWPTVLQSIALIRFRHRFVPAMHRRYGDVFTVRIMPKGSALVLFTRPDAAREIFAGNPDTFHAGKGNAILGPIMGEHSLLLQDGAEHKRARKLLMPAFNGAALRGYEDLVTTIARDEVARWRTGEPFRSLDRMNALTLEVILRVVFGVTDEARLRELRPRVTRTVDVSPAVLFGWGYPWLRRIGPWRATVQNQRELDRLMYDEIAERRRAGDLADRTDVLSRLLSVGEDAGEQPLSDAELRDQLVTLLLAGHETTATALSWALYELGRDPAQLARAQRAADAGAHDPDAGRHLEAVMKESMRLHPVIPMVVRHLMEPATIGGVDLPRGANVGPSILIGHGRAESFPEPQRFRPERFLDDEVAPHTWIPFGGGVRRCIGAGFSLMEGVVVLREVLTAYDVSTGGRADRPKVRNITSVPRGGAVVSLTARS